MKCNSNFIKTVVFVISTSFVGIADANINNQIPYYGDDFYKSYNAGSSNEQLLISIKKVLKSTHAIQNGQNDSLATDCPSGARCYQHTVVGYDPARKYLLGTFYLVKNNDSYSIKDVYCDTFRDENEFPGDKPAPGQIPDGTIVNTEHTWPQSRFTSKFPKEMQKSDMHHLFPTDSQLNSIRGNQKFGEVTKDVKDLKCAVSRFGLGNQGNQEVFEPPKAHRGNVARALFYFSTRYDIGIDSEEEKTLRKWNKEDPVDAEEVSRNNEIYKLQKNRNPFVDYPELIDKINTFDQRINKVD